MNIKRIIREELEGFKDSTEEDWEWVKGVPSADAYRYFDINVCWESWYDESTGEDECVNGGSYFVKIPLDVVPEIWDYETDDEYIAGPGDEGLGVIQWANDNGLMDDYDDPYEYVDYVEYVRELSKSEFCRVWGNYQEEDEELCYEYKNK